MFIIWGTRYFNKLMGQRKEWCFACKNATMDYIRTAMWFTLFFIPIFPISFKYSKSCTMCGYSTCLKKKEFFDELDKPDELPPCPFSDESTQIFKEDAIEYTGTRRLTITREKRFYAALMKINFFVDGNLVATLKNGESFSLEVDGKQKRLYAASQSVDVEYHSNIILLSPGSNNVNYTVKMKGQSLILEETFAESNAI